MAKTKGTAVDRWELKTPYASDLVYILNLGWAY